MGKEVLLSLCIPTNGICEWVFPVIDSIYSEKHPTGEFEVVVTDNGNNVDFEEGMAIYLKKYKNLVYKKTNSIGFMNQIDAFDISKGKLLKFVNHRMMLEPGALNYLLDFAKNNANEEPATYFMNGTMEIPISNRFDNFNDYANCLSYRSSWSAGTSIWKKDWERIRKDEFNQTFPHMALVLLVDKSSYCVDNTVLMRELDNEATKKGNYDLFKAFLVEYVGIIENLYKSDKIDRRTFEKVKKDNLFFVGSLYFDYVLRNKPCSYNLEGYKDSINVYYSHHKLLLTLPNVIINKLLNKIKV